MNASAEESARLAVDDQRPAERWLEALSTGACDQAKFLQVVDPLVHAKPDAAWEVLSLLDQYHRRGAIESGQFRALKAHIAQEGVNAERRAGVSTGIPLTPRRSGDASISPTSAPSAPPPPTMRPVPAAPVIAVRPEPTVGEGAFALRPGDLVRGRYRLLALLGQGRTGTVFEASDEYQVARRG